MFPTLQTTRIKMSLNLIWKNTLFENSIKIEYVSSLLYIHVELILYLKEKPL